MMLAIVRGAAPRHASDIAGNEERSAQAGRCEHALGTKLTHLFAAPVPAGIIGAPGVGSGQLLWRKRPRRDRKRLSGRPALTRDRSEEHTSELQSRFGISYAVFCLKKK